MAVVVQALLILLFEDPGSALSILFLLFQRRKGPRENDSGSPQHVTKRSKVLLRRGLVALRGAAFGGSTWAPGSVHVGVR